MQRGKNQWKSVEKWAFDPRCSITPEPMATKFGVGDEVGDPYSFSKFHHDPIRRLCSPSPPPSRAHARALIRLVITALHVMQTRSSEENSVCPSVRPSVRHTRDP